MITATASYSLTQGNDNVSANVSIADGDEKVYSQITAAASATTVYDVTGLPTAVKAYAILSDTNLTLTTANASGTPDSVPIVANAPLFWNNQMGLAKHFANANNWTSWSFVNATATPANVTVLIIRDGTP
jgi:hypothetical protein